MAFKTKEQCAIQEFYTDEDGIWCILKPGWGWGTDNNKVLHCESFTEFRREWKNVHKISKENSQ